MGEKPVEYFYRLIGTRHTDPEDGLQYKVTEIKVNKKKEIAACRKRIYKGQYEENVDKHYHVADIYSYTKINLNDFMELTDDTQEKQPIKSTSEKRVRSETLAGDAERWSSGPQRSDGQPTRPSSKHTSPNSVSVNTGLRRQSSRVSKRLELPEPPSMKACHISAMLTAMTASVAARVSFSLLATTELKRGSLVPTKVHLNDEDYEPSHRKYMLLCKNKVKWKAGEREELN
jgi:hypothetical protein